jgi:hypothetical protein
VSRRAFLVSALAVAGAAAALAGCGGSSRPSASTVLDRAEAGLGDIRSGRLHVDLALDADVRGGEPLGFSLDGPFSLGTRGSLPISRITYVQRRGSRSAAVTVVSDGGRGYVTVGGKTYELTGTQASQLRAATSGLAQGGLASVPSRDWVRDPRVEDAGGDAYRVSGRLDVVRALNGLFRLTQGLGTVPSVPPGKAGGVERGVRSSSFELVAGKKDHLLRRLRISATFGGRVPQPLRRTLGSLVGAELRFELGVTHPNEPVHVAAPAHALPASALPRG